jgi:hypothetical protein
MRGKLQRLTVCAKLRTTGTPRRIGTGITAKIGVGRIETQAVLEALPVERAANTIAAATGYVSALIAIGVVAFLLCRYECEEDENNKSMG